MLLPAIGCSNVISLVALVTSELQAHMILVYLLFLWFPLWLNGLVQFWDDNILNNIRIILVNCDLGLISSELVSISNS